MISIDFQINLKTMFHLTRLATSLQNRPPHHYDPINEFSLKRLKK